MVASTTSSSTEDALSKLMERGFEQLSKADKNAGRGGEEKTVKLLGLVEVPEMFATVAKGLWNDGSDEFVKWLQKSSHPKFMQAAETVGLKGSAQIRTAAVATIALNTAVRSGLYINPVFEAFKKQHRAQLALANKVAPVLDELKKKHTVGALMGVHEKDNAMLYYARKSLAMKTSMDITNNVTELLINVVPGLVLQHPQNKRMWQGDMTHADVAADGNNMKNWVKRIVNFGLPTVAKTYAHSNERKLNRTITSPYSALDMVLELNEQMANNLKATSFQLPGKNSGTLSLEKYIEKICLTHQKNMADINPDHVEIRDALKEDLDAAVKPLAAAMRKGDLTALSLVRLIGEGKIIKNRGRAVVNAEDIEALIEKTASHQSTYVHTDLKEYYKGTPYTRDELKAALKAAQGLERDLLIVVTPDDALHDAGMGHDEIKEKRTTINKEAVQRILAEAVVGISAQPEDMLRKNLASSEIKGFKALADKITDKGEAAIEVSGAGHAQGVEQKVANWAVQTITGDKAYLGTVLKEGHEKYQEMAEETEGFTKRAMPNVKAKLTKEGFAHGSGVDFDGAEGGQVKGHHTERHASRTAHGQDAFARGE